MRELTKNEQRKLKVLTGNSVSLTLIEPTETGLKKSIMDATGPVRNFLLNNNFHNYQDQQQGPDYKVMLDAVLVEAAESTVTQASLYRPKTKKGDPRIWFSGLTKVTEASDILALIGFERRLYVVNLTQLPVGKLVESREANPLQELVEAINQQAGAVAQELLAKLKTIARKGFVKSLVNSDTGVGRTLETLLGLEMNSSKSPDYKGIELKSFRGHKSARKGLFAKTPNWELSKFKSRVEILDNFGYWEKGIFRLYNTIRATGRNAQGLILRIEYENDWLVENSDKTEIGDFITWELDVLKKALVKKHKETFWVSTENKIEDGNEFFLYKSVEHTKNPLVNQFELLVEMGAITLDYPIKRLPSGAVIDKGCNFKLKSNCLDLLFPPSKNYDLLA